LKLVASSSDGVRGGLKGGDGDGDDGGLRSILMMVS
jgi:hypothetical protein